METSETAEAKSVEGVHKEGGRSSEAIQPSKHGIPPQRSEVPVFAAETMPHHTLTGDVTWLRVLRWLALAFVPSSLMLGATTYITTDIAAIAFLWVVPLRMYLLASSSFSRTFRHGFGWL